MEILFKVGDHIRAKDGRHPNERINPQTIYTVEKVEDSGRLIRIVELPPADNGGTGRWLADYFELVKGSKAKKAQPPRFILQYSLDNERSERFETEREVRARIAEIVHKHVQLKRDSIKVYEIKNVRAVKLGTSIKFTK